MRKIVSVALFVLSVILSEQAFSHCQMPCGIYHDDMVYDQIDQYVETMFKAMTEISNMKTTDPLERNQFTRWIILKEHGSDETAQLITTYFLQQKIKPGEEDTVKRLISAHKLLFLLVQIKQHADRKFVEDFEQEWDKFKLYFHVEGYECKMEQLKLKRREEAEKKEKEEEEQLSIDGKTQTGEKKS